MCLYVYMSICMYVCVYVHIYVYIYIYIERERERNLFWNLRAALPEKASVDRHPHARCLLVRIT